MAAAVPRLTARHLSYALSGWTFFIVENAVLSENREYIIRSFGEDRYFAVYGTCSTLAMLSIVYGYRQLPVSSSSSIVLSVPRIIGSSLTLGLGGFMASQALPSFQLPVAPNEHGTFRVRCPLDFTHATAGGLERISRHAGLWTLAFWGMGNACFQAHPARVCWNLGPTAVALLGGSHADSRFRRGIGGTLNDEESTSNVPFWAMLQQGPSSFVALARETKPLNAAIGVSLALAVVARRVSLARVIHGKR